VLLTLRHCALSKAKYYLALAMFSLCLPAQAELARADKLKAAYLFNFIKFIEWPSSTRDIHLCSHANEAFNTFLGALVSSRPTQAGSVRVLPYSTEQHCELVYLRSTPRGFNADQTSALVVGDRPEFIQVGAEIRFYRSGNFVRFEASPNALAKKQLQLSSQLLKLSKIVEQP